MYFTKLREQNASFDINNIYIYIYKFSLKNWCPIEHLVFLYKYYNYY